MNHLNKYLIIFLFFHLTNIVFAQTDTGYLWSYELNGQAWKDWDSIEQTWLTEVYFPCLETNHLKMSCASCASIFIEAIFTIDCEGKLIDIKILRENICTNKASDALKECLFGFYKIYIFPPSLRNKKLKAKFGTGLKC